MTWLAHVQNLERCAARLAEASARFDAYLEQRHESLSPDQMAVALEVANKLMQCKWLIEEIRRRIEDFAPRINMESLFKDQIPIWILTESFYYFAWRMIKAMTALPDFPDSLSRKFVGVRDVRNNLLEHPAGVLATSFGLTDAGPAVKALRRPEDPDQFHDKGLYPNVEELVSVFISAVDQVLTPKSV